jgi:hypothetical protein
LTLGITGIAYAAQYAPGETLNPNCFPIDSNCTVSTSTASILATANTFTNTNAFNAGLTANTLSVGSLSGLLFGTNGSVGTISTSTLNINTDNLVQGNTNKFYADSLVNSYVNGSSTIAKTYVANTWNALQTFGNNISLGGAQLNMGALTSGNLMSYNGTNWVNVSTSSLNLTIPLASTTGTLGIANGGTGTTTFSQGWLYSNGGTGALSASPNPTVGYLTATSTTIASFFPLASTNTLNIGQYQYSGGVPSITSASSIIGDGNGNLCEDGQSMPIFVIAYQNTPLGKVRSAVSTYIMSFPNDGSGCSIGYEVDVAWTLAAGADGYVLGMNDTDVNTNYGIIYEDVGNVGYYRIDGNFTGNTSLSTSSPTSFGQALTITASTTASGISGLFTGTTTFVGPMVISTSTRGVVDIPNQAIVTINSESGGSSGSIRSILALHTLGTRYATEWSSGNAGEMMTNGSINIWGDGYDYPNTTQSSCIWSYGPETARPGDSCDGAMLTISTDVGRAIWVNANQSDLILEVFDKTANTPNYGNRVYEMDGAGNTRQAGFMSVGIVNATTSPSGWTTNPYNGLMFNPPGTLTVYGSSTMPYFAIVSTTTPLTASSTLTNSTSVFIVDKTGNVGIGTTSPYAKLSIQNNYGSTNTTLFAIASSTASNGSSASNLFSISNTGVFTASTTNASAATSTINGNLYVHGALRSTTSYNGDLFFSNNFSFTEAPLDGSPQGLLLKNQNGSQVLSVDENGNLSVNGDVCSNGTQCFGKSLSSLTKDMNALASSTSLSILSTTASTGQSLSELSSSLAAVSQAIIDLNIKVDSLSSTTMVLASTTAIDSIASSTALTLASSTPSFIARIALAVQSLIQSAGNWTVNQITATLAVFTDVKTKSIETQTASIQTASIQTASVKNGIEMTDSVTSKIYCIRIANGDFDKTQGSCAETATSTAPAANQASSANIQVPNNNQTLVIDNQVTSSASTTTIATSTTASISTDTTASTTASTSSATTTSSIPTDPASTTPSSATIASSTTSSGSSASSTDSGSESSVGQ